TARRATRRGPPHLWRRRPGRGAVSLASGQRAEPHGERKRARAGASRKARGRPKVAAMLDARPHVAGLLALTLLVGCGGDDGPKGPAGANGAAGPDGTPGT